MTASRSARRGATLIAATALLAGGCSNPRLPDGRDIPFVYRMEIPQGNVVTQEQLAQLKAGMPPKTVRLIMGTPLIRDTFHPERWDYIYSLTRDGDERVQRRVTLVFSDGRLHHIEGDVKAAPGRLEVRRQRSQMVAVPGEYQPSVLGRLKKRVDFWHDDEPRQAQPEETNTGDATSVDSAAAEAGKDTDTDTDTDANTESGDDPGVLVPDEPPAEQRRGFFARLWERMKGRSDAPTPGPRAPEGTGVPD